MVETTVDLEALDHHEFIIKPEFDESLKTIWKRLDRLKYDMEVEHRKAGQDLNQDTEKKLFLENHRVHGWCFRLTRNVSGMTSCQCPILTCRRKQAASEIRSSIRNVRRRRTVCTLPPMHCRRCVESSTSCPRTTIGRRRDWSMRSSAWLVGVTMVQDGFYTNPWTASYCPVIEQMAGVLAHLDVIVSFAHVSVHAPTSYVRPKMHRRGEGNTILKEARHPCMEMQDDMQFITNDIELRRGTSEFLIITGPNMGGKSTYIRQIGVIALMAQTGCFVPCSEAELCLFDCILARVGASDSQLKGVSTFMAEMLETANILRSATAESLIIIDELGRGTSTYDGFGLAWAISEHIVKEIRCFALFATHFHELTALAETYCAVKNLHVVAHISNSTGDDDEMNDDDRNARKAREVTLLYKVSPGICDQSFGIHVAELVRFPEKVINMAKRKADELEDFSGKHDGNLDQHGDAHPPPDASAPAAGAADVGEEGKSEEEIQRGASLLRDLLKRWKDEVEHTQPNSGDDGDGRKEVEWKMRKMREMVLADQELVQNPFFRDLQRL